jgi:NAD(P)-dependent dehydrogenase (short-subunit alcohol dehydrogenase family)
MDLQLKEKTVLVTGSTAGIGFSIAKQLLQEGATVYVNGRTQQRVDEAIRELKTLQPQAKVFGVAADFSKVEEVNQLLGSLPLVDVLINNVGIFETKDFTAIPDADWTRFFEVNVLSGVRLSRHYLPGMLKRNWGRILFISSESAINIPVEMIHYGMTKTAQLSVSRGIAELTRGTNVTVNSVLPGPTSSEGLEKMVEKQKMTIKDAEAPFFQKARPTSLLQRFASTDEIANLVTYLSSPLSSATNGAALRVDGGILKTIF